MLESQFKEKENLPNYSEAQLVVSKDDGTVILSKGGYTDIDDYFSGIVVFCAENHYSLGENRSDWIKDNFTLFMDEIILKNK